MFARLLALVIVVVLATTALTPVTRAEAQPAPSRTFRELGYEDQTARTMYGSLSYVFAVPRGRLPQPGAQVELVVSHSPLLEPERSTLTVVANGQSLTSVFLTAENRERARIAVPLPVEGFSGDRYVVQVQFSLWLTREECEEPQNPALWATVHGDSRLTLPTRDADEGPSLADLPALLFPAPGDGPSAALLMGLPFPGGSREELQAAGLVAFQYGRWAGAAGRDALLDATQTPPAGGRGGVVVGTPAALALREPLGPLRWDGRALTLSGVEAPSGDGVLALTRGERPVLSVTGATPAAVLKAAEALAQPEQRALLAGEAALVSGQTVPWNAAGRPWRNGAASFAQLGTARQEVTGPGLHTILVRHERPPGWIVEQDSTLELAIESAAALRRESSWVAARVNGIDLGSQRLEPAAGEAGRYTFPLPAAQLNADLNGRPLRGLELEVRLYLDIPQVGCIQTAPESARAALLPTSAWRLPHRQYRGLELGRFPAMFFASAGVPTAVVIPERASPVELATGLEMMAALGRWSGSDEATWPRLLTADAVTDADRNRYHLILIGSPTRNTISEAAARHDRDLAKKQEPAIYPFAGGRASRWATLQLTRSPWGRGRLLLMVGGTDPDAVRLGSAALARGETLAQIQGRTVTVAEGSPPQTLTAAEPPEPPPSALAPRVVRPFRDRVKPWQVAGAVGLGGFIIVVTLVLTGRLRRRRVGQHGA